MKVILKSNLDCVEELIRAGADVNFTMYEKTAIVIAAKYGKENALKLLIEAGVDINCNVHKYGLTPLMVASIYGHLECVKLLIQSVVDLDMEDDSGRTALQHAARCYESSWFYHTTESRGRHSHKFHRRLNKETILTRRIYR